MWWCHRFDQGRVNLSYRDLDWPEALFSMHFDSEWRAMKVHSNSATLCIMMIAILVCYYSPRPAIYCATGYEAIQHNFLARLRQRHC
jgi:hypothetical protein